MWNGNVASVIVLPITNVASCQFVLILKLDANNKQLNGDENEGYSHYNADNRQ